MNNPPRNSAHSPTPWANEKGRGIWIRTKSGPDIQVADVPKDEDAAFIVRAVNVHDEAIDGLKDAVKWLSMMKPTSGLQNMVARFNSIIAKASPERSEKAEGR